MCKIGDAYPVFFNVFPRGFTKNFFGHICWAIPISGFLVKNRFPVFRHLISVGFFIAKSH